MSPKQDPSDAVDVADIAGRFDRLSLSEQLLVASNLAASEKHVPVALAFTKRAIECAELKTLLAPRGQT